MSLMSQGVIKQYKTDTQSDFEFIIHSFRESMEHRDVYMQSIGMLGELFMAYGLVGMQL